MCRMGDAFLPVLPPTVSSSVCDAGQVDVPVLAPAASVLQMKRGKRRSTMWEEYDSDAKYKMDKKDSGTKEVEAVTLLLQKKEKARNGAQELREKLDKVDHEMTRNHEEAQLLMQEVQKDIEIQRMLRKESTDVMERMVDLKKLIFIS
jgi:hypothetical protein